MRSSQGAALLRRVLAALLLVAFPVMTARMAVVGAEHQPAMHAHAGHHGADAPQHPAGHQTCCDFCGAACGCSVHFASLRLPPSPPVFVAVALAPAPRADRPTGRVPYLLPLALGPPLHSA